LLQKNDMENTKHIINIECTIEVPVDYQCQIIGRITDCLFQDASSFNKSHIVTIVKSQWYDRRLVHLLFRLYFVLLNVEDDT